MDDEDSNGGTIKKATTENEPESSVNEENGSSTSPRSSSPNTGTVTEEEIRAFLAQKGLVTTHDLVAKFTTRLKTPEDKKAFANILRRISKIQKTTGASYVVLGEKERSSPSKPVPSVSSKGTPRTMDAEDVKPSEGGTVKKVNTENEPKSSGKEENGSSKSSVPSKISSKTGPTSSSNTGTITEKEKRAFLEQKDPVTTQDLVFKLRTRLKTVQDKKAFADTLRRISMIQKRTGATYVVLREKARSSPSKPVPFVSSNGTPRKMDADDVKPSEGGTVKKVKTDNEPKSSVKEENGSSKSSVPSKSTSKTGPTSSSNTGTITEEEIRAFLVQKDPMITQDLVSKFKTRLKTAEDKKAFADTLRRFRRIYMIQKRAAGASYVELREKARSSPSKPVPFVSSKGTSRKMDADDVRPSEGGTVKKVKTDNEPKSSVREENGSSKSTVPSESASETGRSSSSSTGAITEEEIRAVLVKKGPVAPLYLVAKFKTRLKTIEDQKSFAATLRRISKIQTTSGASFVVLRE